MALEMTVDRAGAASTAVLALSGELDASNFSSLIDEGRRLHDDGVGRLVLDLSGLAFLASSGLVALHSLVRIMRGEEPPDPEAGWSAIHSLEFDVAGGTAQTDVQLCCPQPAVARVLERTGLKRLFLVHEDLSAATAGA